MKSKKLDFIIIGAPKAGTTTLYDIMSKHPEIYMPKEKEAPFFDDDTVYKKGLDWYLNTFFNKAPEDNNISKGTVTPQYMIGKDKVNPEIVANRIHNAFPEVKIIAILRNPIKRSISHYNMLLQRGYFKDDFEVNVSKLLNSDLDNKRRGNISDEYSYLFCSEYGRILSSYYDIFPRDNILILFTDDLYNEPKNVINKIYEHIGVSKQNTQEANNKKSRVGGTEPKLRILTPGYIYKIPFVKKVWQKYTPYKLRKIVEYNLNLWNTKPGKKMKLSDSSETYIELTEFFKTDIILLKKLLRMDKLPWKEWE